MMFERFTERARKVLILARDEAKHFNHDYVGTEHLLLGLIKEGQGVAAAVLQNLGLDLATIRLEVEKLVKPGPDTIISGDIPFTPKAKKVLELSMDEARKLGHNYIGTEHLLLGLLGETDGMASQVLINSGLDLNKVRMEVMNLLGGAMPPPGSSGEAQAGTPGAKSKTPALDTFGRDLTALAHDNKLDPVIGRKDEIERVIQILSRRTKNNPVLLGEAGVGKTAIVEGLAQNIVEGNIPEILKNQRVVVLDLAMMVAGTKYRGQFEERIKAVMEEIRRSEKIIIFIDELHTLVGAGGAEGAIDASNMLKPALSRGEMQCIGATTLNEYRKYIEKDAALERRFQTINVDPPSVEDTVEILKGLRDRYEAHHKVKFTDGALAAAAKMSNRYIAGRFLPDKAIDLIDEAGARARLSMTTAPSELQDVEKEVARLKNEKEASVTAQDFEKAAQLRDRERKAKKKLEEIKNKWDQSHKEETGTEVTEEDIAYIVSKWTGVPVTTLETAEGERLLNMEESVHDRIVGQEEAIKAIARAVRRSRAGIKDPKRPIGSFIFLGPTGVGKTLLARVLAEFMFGEEEALLQYDMSEYMEKFNVSRLIGAPPGYVGYEEGGQLSEKVRRRPYSVVLLDEIEKAHPDVFNLLLQVLEDGRLTDSFGRKIDFSNVILIMTSNIGAELIKKQGSLGFSQRKEETTYKEMQSKLMEAAKKAFRPEFLNRVDDTIVFRQLTKEDLQQIIEIELKGVKQRLAEREINIEITSKAKDFLIEKGYDPVYGARPLRRTIQKYVEDPLAEEILKGEFKNGKTIKVTLKQGHLEFESKN
ncbi:MAG: ATP-dependent Clp protease ATP-binding subunit [Candidatus Omnitrophica bacterium]|nr:ATP-dependent Clp protease ATP-binding subunit [Candidatus Omnitrophota bacterium]